MAFLIASPWNSLSLTIILIALIGLKWTLLFILLSAIIALISGLIFNALIIKGVLPSNPARQDLPKSEPFLKNLKEVWHSAKINPKTFYRMGMNGIGESRMILRWIFLGVILAALFQTFLSTDQFQTFFGPDLMGLGITLPVATIIETCSEGTAPIAADILNRAAAPGNAFTFMMTGAATDYTEILGLKETTGSWKIPLFLPLVTVPQVLLISYLINVL